MNKAHILQEIKRTAQSNGGVPLGWRRFLSETGIKQADWFPVHWARWSEALREAGYEPNQLTESYDSDELLELYAKLALELERLPTNADMRYKAKKDSSFPAEATFRKRWSKAELIARLLEYCRGREGYELVVRLCEEYTPRTQADEVDDLVESEGTESEPTMGYVYLIKMGRFYKIGMTNSVGRREYELALQLPEQPVLIHQISTDDPAGIEEYWHKRFAKKNTNGEWFALDASDVAAFKRRKFM